ncbi:DUF899 domain-containing protein [Bacteriovoracaceae bacterium]|nr:DUF899 domain-containing protein [Bacteriovoracaceae bacterium]
MSEIAKIEQQIMELSFKLNELRKNNEEMEVPNYNFETSYGNVSLKQLFGKKDKLLLIHNMGQGCRYCTLWADGINAFLPHLESKISVTLASKDDPEVQNKIAHDRGWRFRMVSHQNNDYLKEQRVYKSDGDGVNHPGISCFTLKDEKIYRKNYSSFGPGDSFCSFWHLISLAGEDANSFTPQFSYWEKPKKCHMEDGGSGYAD